MNFTEHLPKEITFNIFSFLDTNDCYHLSSVNKKCGLLIMEHGFNSEGPYSSISHIWEKEINVVEKHAYEHKADKIAKNRSFSICPSPNDFAKIFLVTCIIGIFIKAMSNFK